MRNFLKATAKYIIKFIVPRILNPFYLLKLYRKIFFKDKVELKFEYEKNFYSRIAFINKAIANFKDCKYLEIGVNNNSVFNSIPLKLEKKFGVDPVSGGNFRMTSDEFFLKNKNLKFNVIFIDGLHEYKQCYKDCINAINQLEKNGIIFFHDLLPRAYLEQAIPRSYSPWTGDVWKVAIELAHSNNLEFRIVNIDMGVGILKIKDGFEYKKINNIENQDFKEFLKYKETLPIISSAEALDFIDQEK